MDPLTVFREFVQGNQLNQVEVDAAAGMVRFADKYSFPISAATAFRREGTDSHYPLGVIVNYYKWFAENKAITEYIRKYTSRSDQVAMPDRQDLVSYLTGKAATVKQLDENVPVVPVERPAKKQKLGEPGEGESLSHMFTHEKQLRDRNSLLCAPGANFTPILQLVDKVLAARKQTEAAAAKASAAAAAKAAQALAAAGQQRQHGAPHAQHHKQPVFVKSSGRGDRDVDAKGTLKALGAEKRVAEKLGLGYGLAAGAAADAHGRSNAAAAAAAGGSSQHKSSGGKGAADPRAAGRSAAAGQKGGGSSGSGKLRPIILVPAGYSALVNLWNAKQLLEETRFINTEEAKEALERKQQGKPTAPLEFVRRADKPAGQHKRYEITDKVPKPTHPDWKRVVAVIVQGKPWQFKEFPFKGANKGDMVDTFSNVFGAYFYHTGDTIPEAVQGWKVAKLELRRDTRHLDDQVVLSFYKQLDAFLKHRRRDNDLDY